ncbi:MAG: hypothetical protein V2A70_07520 [Candidatus Omnitrophota bacterium]
MSLNFVRRIFLWKNALKVDMRHNKCVRFIGWVVLYVIVLEILIRSGGGIFGLWQRFQNERGLDKGVYKIMCLGDSVTIHGGENSYPAQMEKMLNASSGRKGMTFKVINMGLGGGSSQVILANVERFLDEYRPNMVTVMMGGVELYATENVVAASGRNKLFSGFMAYHFLKKVLDHCQARIGVLTAPFPWFHQAVVPLKAQVAGSPQEKPVLREDANKLLFAIACNAHREYVKAEVILKYLVRLDTTDKVFLDRVYAELGQCLFAQGKFPDVASLTGYYLKVDPADTRITDKVVDFCRRPGLADHMLAVLHALAEGNPQSVPLNDLLAVCLQVNGHAQEASEYFAKGRKILGSQGGVNAVLRRNYLRLHEILKARGVKEVYVQYAGRNVDALKKIFDGEDQRGIVFVSTDDDFKPAHDLARYKEYFLDHAFIDTGHPTYLGNHIIARRLSEVVEKMVRP